MKLLTEKKRKIAVYFTGGLGDTLLYVPLLKELKKKKFSITCIFYSKFNSDCLFDESLFDSKVFIKNKASLLLYSITRLKYFSNIYINHLAKGKVISIAANVCSKRITTISFAHKPHSFQKRNKKALVSFSDAEQNLNFLYTSSNAAINSINSFYLPHPLLNKPSIAKFTGNLFTKYYILQVSAGNNTTPFKNWPQKNWLALTTMLCNTYSNTLFIITGDNSETHYIKAFEDLKLINCKIVIGKTAVEDIFNLTAFSDGYIGLDSGIMHMAVALKKKTVSIFGASNEKLYGYSFLDHTNHKVITADIPCRPCSSWRNANTSRVTNPLQCPDFACLTSIDPLLVFQQITTHFTP
jgi:ADP-heptose:LPS heptosyltransferase